MSIVLDHTIVPARDKEESARFLARILGLRYEGTVSHFAPVHASRRFSVFRLLRWTGRRDRAGRTNSNFQLFFIALEDDNLFTT
jgi:catechol 2,3-dioxygenase-like lactoylglutathione lyase family enzyme